MRPLSFHQGLQKTKKAGNSLGTEAYATTWAGNAWLPLGSVHYICKARTSPALGLADALCTCPKAHLIRELRKPTGETNPILRDFLPEEGAFLLLYYTSRAGLPCQEVFWLWGGYVYTTYISVVTQLAKNGKPLATNLCNTSGLNTQCSIEADLASRSSLLHSPWVQDGHAQVGFSQKQVISLKTFTVTFTCAEAVPVLCYSIPPPPGLPLHPSTTNLLSVTVSQ